jgi:opacity protein-like surface antigen
VVVILYQAHQYVHKEVERMIKIKSILTFLLLIITVPGFAAVVDYPWVKAMRGLEFSVAGGPTISHVDDTSLIVSPFETDNVIVTNVTRSALWKIGVGYHFFEDSLKQRRYFNDFLVELNVYRNSETARGDVWRYQLPQFNNYSFAAPITTTSAMLDVKPGLFTLRKFTLYPIIGVGAAWSTVSYQEHRTANSVDPTSYHSLGDSMNMNFSYDLGVGLRLGMTEHLSATMEYIYSYLIDLHPAGESTTTAELLAPPEFTIANQSLLFGLSWKI